MLLSLVINGLLIWLSIYYDSGIRWTESTSKKTVTGYQLLRGRTIIISKEVTTVDKLDAFYLMIALVTFNIIYAFSYHLYVKGMKNYELMKKLNEVQARS